MSLPEWMPPISDKVREETRVLLREYAIAAVEAYKASLKPSFHMLVHGEGMVKLYRLD